MDKLPGNIKFLRQSKNWTQEQLGEKLGLKKAAISRYEKGLSYPPLEKLDEISKIFSTSLDDLAKTNLSKIDLPNKAEEPISIYKTNRLAVIKQRLSRNRDDLTDILRELDDILDQ